jgi:uncharacterized protein (TIGR03437 family)
MRILLLCVTPLAAVTLWSADTTAPVAVNAANPQAGIAPDSLASIYGSQLATQTVAAGNPPWPTSLGGVNGVTLVDSAGKSWPVPLIFVSPTQMNVWIPPGPSLGPANLGFTSTGGPPDAPVPLRTVPLNLQTVAPALFTADGTGLGVLAASAVQVSPIGQFPVTVFTCSAPGSCSPVPIGLGVDTPVYLSLYGTGIRNWANIGTALNAYVTIGTETFPAAYAGPQPTIPGLDQVNVPLSLSLRGAGLVDVSLTVAGMTTNAGQIMVN